MVTVPAPAAPAAPQQSVLVISSDNLSYPFIGQLFGAFKTTLQSDNGAPVHVYAESLDLSTFGAPAQQAAAARWYDSKYREVPLDVVVVIGHAALRFWIDAGFRPGVPVYFAAASASAMAGMPLPPRVTGQRLRIDLAQTVRLARQLFPDTTTIALVGNAAERDSYRPFKAPELLALAGEANFIDLRGKAYEQVLARVAHLPPHTVIYHTTLTDDGSGRVFEPRTALTETARVANRPTLIDNGSQLGSGALGGLVTDPVHEGSEAARRVVQLLRGAAPASLPTLDNSNLPRFDWRAMQRWQLAESRLPRGSELQFYQPSAWQQYRLQILLTVAVLALLSLLTVALLIERRRRAAAVAQSRQRLAELAHMNRNATASVFSAAIAHELNQPLAAILSNAETAELLLEQPMPPLTELREILADIRRDDARASELIVRMRTLLKPSAADSRLADINELIRQSLTFIAGEARLRGAALSTSMAPAPAWVLVDPVQIQQVIINLVINSLDAVAGLAPAARRIVVASAVQDDAQVEVSVRDTGPGFASADIERVFDSFFTTKPQGMGLGLSITAAIVAGHGGTIHAENQRGGGARVRFSLPLRKAP
ncbi:MAG: ABC transporter substrate binding protein [Massilia sp.]